MQRNRHQQSFTVCSVNGLKLLFNRYVTELQIEKKIIKYFSCFLYKDLLACSVESKDISLWIYDVTFLDSHDISESYKFAAIYSTHKTEM